MNHHTHTISTLMNNALEYEENTEIKLYQEMKKRCSNTIT